MYDLLVKLDFNEIEAKNLLKLPTEEKVKMMNNLKK